MNKLKLHYSINIRLLKINIFFILILCVIISCNTSKTPPYPYANDVVRKIYNPNKYTTTSIELKEYEEENSKELTITVDNYPIHPNCENKVSKKCFVELLNNEVQNISQMNLQRN